MRKPTLLSDHDVKEVVAFQRYLDELAETVATEAFYRKHQAYMGLSDAELKEILSRGEPSRLQEGEGK